MGSDTKGILSLIFGICGLCCFGLIFGIIALILGYLGKQDHEKYSEIGMILGIIDIILALLGMFFWAAMWGGYGLY